MAFEIDFLPVGNGDKSGDAIAIRYGQPGKYTVMVYDGGTKESGQSLVEHIKKYYQTEYVDHVVNTHPDADHASGLSVVLEQLKVGKLWLHRPWLYSDIIRDYFKDGRITSDSLKRRLQEKMAVAYQLEQLAIDREVAIEEPFQGSFIGEFRVLSPEKNWYIHELIAEFQKSPEQKTPEYNQYKKMGEAVVNWIAEVWEYELLRESVKTSAENESSVILYEQQNGILLTGDAGVKALSKTEEYSKVNDIQLQDTKFVQVPHHGSRNNVSTSVLNNILGCPLRGKPNHYEKTAFISAAQNSKTHPRKMVVNSFIRRGFKVIATKGSIISYRSPDMPSRDGWGVATPLEFYGEVEQWT